MIQSIPKTLKVKQSNINHFTDAIDWVANPETQESRGAKRSILFDWGAHWVFQIGSFFPVLVRVEEKYRTYQCPTLDLNEAARSPILVMGIV